MKVPKAGGCPEALASALPSPNSIALGGSWIYWGDDDTGTVERVSTDGSTREVVISGQVGPGAPYLFGRTLYWINLGAATSPDSLTGSIMALDLDGGVPRELVSGLADPNDLVVDATGLFWTAFGAYPAPDPCCPGGVFTAPLTGGAPAALAITNISGVLALTPTSVFWASDLGICEVSKRGGPYTLLVPSPVYSFAMDATGLFWDWPGDPNQAFDDGWVAEQALDGGPRHYAANPVSYPSGMAVDDSFVYWTDFDPSNGSIMRAPK